MPEHAVYQSPLVARYASKEMASLFGAEHRIRTWRRLWLALARAQRRAGLKITAKQIQQLERTAEEIDFKVAARYEKKLRHDVMAHLLRSRILEAKEREAADQRAEQRRTLIGSGDRSERIRTYNFPQGRVTDHRIGVTLYKLDRVMQGELDALIEQMLEFDRQERLQRGGEQDA